MHHPAKRTAPRAPESRLDLPGFAWICRDVELPCLVHAVHGPYSHRQEPRPSLKGTAPAKRQTLRLLLGPSWAPPVTGLSQPIPRAQCGSEPPRGTRSFNPRQGLYSPLCTDGCVRHQEVTDALQGGRRFIQKPLRLASSQLPPRPTC